jgi:UDP-glucose/GDP-mannose dehydrogenase family, NAD binding domain
MICVDTPANPDGETNLAAVERAALDIARDAAYGVVDVGKSTVPAGTVARIRKTFERERPDASFPPRLPPRVPPRGDRRSRFPRAGPTPGRADDAEGFDAIRRLYTPTHRCSSEASA